MAVYQWQTKRDHNTCRVPYKMPIKLIQPLFNRIDCAEVSAFPTPLRRINVQQECTSFTISIRFLVYIIKIPFENSLEKHAQQLFHL